MNSPLSLYLRSLFQNLTKEKYLLSRILSLWSEVVIEYLNMARRLWDQWQSIWFFIVLLIKSFHWIFKNISYEVTLSTNSSLPLFQHSLFQNSTKEKDFARSILSLWSKVLIKCWYLALRLWHHWHYYIWWDLGDFICLY